MTRPQRDRIVELLRCAADMVDDTLTPLVWASHDLGETPAMFNAAVRFKTVVTIASTDVAFVEGDRYRRILLETAALVEERAL